jgi:hypothetical protein
MASSNYTSRQSKDMTLMRLAHKDGFELRLRIGDKFETFELLTSHELLMHPSAYEAAQATFEDLCARIQAITGQPIQEVYNWLTKIGATASLGNIISDHYRAPLVKLAPPAPTPGPVPQHNCTDLDMPQARVVGTAMEELFDTLFGVTK